MTRAQHIRQLRSEGYDLVSIAVACERAGYEPPTRQAIERALAHELGAKRGRPRQKPPAIPLDEFTPDELERLELLGSRGWRPVDIARAGIAVVGAFESGSIDARHVLIEAGYERAAVHPPIVATREMWERAGVATVSQTPRKPRTVRTKRANETK